MYIYIYQKNTWNKLEIHMESLFITTSSITQKYPRWNCQARRPDASSLGMASCSVKVPRSPTLRPSRSRGMAFDAPCWKIYPRNNPRNNANVNNGKSSTHLMMRYERWWEFDTTWRMRYDKHWNQLMRYDDIWWDMTRIWDSWARDSWDMMRS